MNIGCNSLENLQLHVIEEYINGFLNPKDIYCLLPKFHQQPINIFLHFGFTILSLLDFHLCTFYLTITRLGLPRWCSSEGPACQCRRCKRRKFSSWIRRIPWRRAWQPTLVFLPGDSHGQKSLAGYSLGSQRVRHD